MCNVTFSTADSFSINAPYFLMISTIQNTNFEFITIKWNKPKYLPSCPQVYLSNAAFLILSSLMCITSVTISCDDRRKPNIKHVLKSAPLPISLQHSAKQYNLKIFHAFFHRYLFVICIIFLLFVFSQSIFRNYHLFHIYNTTLYTHFAICR